MRLLTALRRQHAPALSLQTLGLLGWMLAACLPTLRAAAEPGDTPAASPLPYNPAAYELAPQFRNLPLPWSVADPARHLRARVATEKRRQELDVYYYRIGHTLAFPLPVANRPSLQDLPAGISTIKYPWLIWLSWDLEERWRVLHAAWRQLDDPEAGLLLQKELAALQGWNSFTEMNNQVGLVTGHLSASLALALQDTSGWNPELLRQTRAAADTLLEREVWPWFEKTWQVDRWTTARLGNIPLIALSRAAQLARVLRSPRQEALDQRVRQALEAWSRFRLDQEQHTEGVAYDGYLMDSLTEWLTPLPDRAELLRAHEPAFRSLATHAAALTLPGRLDLQAPLGDVEPEMTYWTTVLARMNTWYRWPDTAWLLRRFPLERMRAPALVEALQHPGPPAAHSTPPANGLAQHPNALTLRTGWEHQDILAVLGLSRGKMGHLHADTGHLLLGWEGRFWITDPGYQQYRPGEERDYTIGPQAHNVPILAGLPQTRREGRCLLAETNAAGACHARLDLAPCYTNLPAGARIERDLWLLQQNGLALVACDTFAGLPEKTEISTCWQGGTHLAWSFREGWARLSDGHRALWFGGHPGGFQASQLTRHPGSRGPLTLTHAQSHPDGQGACWWVFWCDPAGGWTPPKVAVEGSRLRLQPPNGGKEWTLERK